VTIDPKHTLATTFPFRIPSRDDALAGRALEHNSFHLLRRIPEIQHETAPWLEMSGPLPRHGVPNELQETPNGREGRRAARRRTLTPSTCAESTPDCVPLRINRDHFAITFAAAGDRWPETRIWNALPDPGRVQAPAFHACRIR
jgi:hypothetical protein